MGLTRLAITRPLAILMLILGLVLMGGVAFTRLRVDRLPPQSFPFVGISVDLSGASPEDVESLLLEPVEDAVAGLSGVTAMNSNAREGGGNINLQFAEGTDTDRAVIDVERRMAGIRGQLPRDAGAPRVNKFDPNASPIMNITLTGVDLNGLLEIAEDIIQPQLMAIPGVADVTVSGGLRREIRVRLDPARLEAYGISVDQVTSAVQRENVNSPGGSLERERSTVNVRSVGELKSIEELQSVVIATKPAGTIYLRNVATVEETTKPRTRIQRFNGADAVGFSIIKQNDANTLEVADTVRTTLERMKSAIPPEAALFITNDGSRFVRRSVESIQRDLVFAIFLTGTVLLLFLHSWRNTLIVVLAIPTSLISTFLVMYAFGFSLNLMTLMALAMTIGILVDDSIVVLENINRHLSLGEPPFAAALKGRSEIGLAAMAITFTDIVVYLPVAFMAGNIGQLFIQYGLTIAVATLFSLFISFTLTPMLASRWISAADADEEHPQGKGPLGAIFRAWERMFHALQSGYGTSLGWSLRHRPAILVVGAIALAASMSFIPLKLLSTEYAPQEDDGQMNLNVSMPSTSTLAATDEAVMQMEAMLRDIPEIRGAFANANRTSGGIAVELVDKGERTRTVQEIIEQVRQMGRSIPEASVRASASAALGGGGGGNNLTVVIMGDDLEALNTISAQVQEVAKATPGIADASSGTQTRQDETRFVVDRERAAALGVSGSQVGTTIRTLVQGSAAGRLERPGKATLDITVIGPEFHDPRSLMNIPIASGKAGLVRVGQVTSLRSAASPVLISRTDRKRSISVSSTVSGTRALGDVARDLRENLQAIALPTGYRVDVRGGARQLDLALSQLTSALAMSVVLIYMLLVALYESWLFPLAIMFSLPVSMVGAFGALYLTGNTINIFSMMGIIALMGLVAKNAILLVDYTNTLRAEGMGRSQAIVEAGMVRLRPIAMTTLTVIAAMIPLSLQFEIGSESRAPMAVVIIGGSISSTLLTLFLVPVIYTLLDDLQARVRCR